MDNQRENWIRSGLRGGRSILAVGMVVFGLLTGCGGGGNGTNGQVNDPGTVEFRLYADNRITETRYYAPNNSHLTPASAGQLLKSDILIYGRAHFAAYDPSVQDITPTSVFGNARFRVDLTPTANQLGVRIVDTLPLDERMVVTFTLPLTGFSADQVLSAMGGAVSDLLTARAIAEAVTFVETGS